MYLRKELNKILKKKERIKTVTITFDKNCNKNREKKQIIVLMQILLKNNQPPRCQSIIQIQYQNYTYEN